MTDRKQVADAPTGRPVLEGVRAWGRSIKPDRKDFGKDVVAGLPGAISSVPDGMASAVLVGVNPSTACTPASRARPPAASSPAHD